MVLVVSVTLKVYGFAVFQGLEVLLDFLGELGPKNSHGYCFPSIVRVPLLDNNMEFETNIYRTTLIPTLRM